MRYEWRRIEPVADWSTFQQRTLKPSIQRGTQTRSILLQLKTRAKCCLPEWTRPKGHTQDTRTSLKAVRLQRRRDFQAEFDELAVFAPEPPNAGWASTRSVEG